MLSIASLIVVLAFLILIGLVGNVGQRAIQSVEVQNAADSAAVSSGTWMARGLNAITATNHLMGELTAILVVNDALLGPSEISPKHQFRPESEKYNVAVQTLSSTAPWTSVGSAAVSGGQITKFDRDFMNEIRDLLVKDKGRHKSGATVYDARMTLKYLTCVGMAGKALANLIANIFDATVFFSVGGEVLAGVIHVAVDLLLLKVAQEWIFLEGVEAGSSALRDVIGKAVPRLILAISMYGDSLVGLAGDNHTQGPVNVAIGSTLGMVKESHRMTDVGLYPSAEKISLPVVREAPPRPVRSTDQSTLSGPPKKVGKPPSLWNGNDWSGPGREMDRPLEQARSIINRWNDFVESVFNQKYLPSFAKNPKFGKVPDFDQFLDFPAGPGGVGQPDDLGVGFAGNPSFDEMVGRPWEAEAKSQWVRATYPHVDAIRQPTRDVLHQLFGMSNASTYLVNWTNRYTIERSITLREDRSADPAAAKKDSLAGLLASLRTKLARLRKKFDRALQGTGPIAATVEQEGEPFREISKELEEMSMPLEQRLQELESLAGRARDWIERVRGLEGKVSKATGSQSNPEDIDLDDDDRRALVEDLVRIRELHSLLRFIEGILNDVEKLFALLAGGPPHMYVLTDMLPEQKGQEPWTHDQERAEALFSVIGVARLAGQPPAFSPRIFPNPAIASGGDVAYAEALVYNANGRTDGPTGGSTTTQPDTGWDTLNWEPVVQAPEWGAAPTKGTQGGSVSSLLDDFPTRVFQGIGESQPSVRTNTVKLNWQVKLVPVSPTRLRKAVESESMQEQGGISESARGRLKPALEFLNELGRH